MKKLLHDEQAKRIAQAVARAEERSGGEIATAVIAESDDYGFRELVAAVVVAMAAFIIAVAFPAPLELFLSRISWGYEGWMLSSLQGVVAALVGLIAYITIQIPAIDRLVVGQKAMQEAVARRARRHFMEAGVYDTIDRTGVLIFVSYLERRVELIADRGIHEQVDPAVWKEIVAKLVEGIRTNRLAGALEEAVEACGTILAGRVVRRKNDVNELPDTPSQLERDS